MTKKAKKTSLKIPFDTKSMKNFIDMFQPKKSSNEKEKKFETDKKLDHLKLLIIFVKRGHGVAINDLLLENGAAMTNLFYAEGARNRYVTEILGGGDNNRREAVLTIIKDKDYKNIKQLLETRFLISSASNGILLTFNIKSLAGVLAYKYLSDYEGALKYGKK